MDGINSKLRLSIDVFLNLLFPLFLRKFPKISEVKFSTFKANGIEVVMDPWYEENLICPVDHLPLKYSNGALVSSSGREYPVVDGVPVMLIDGAEQTIGVASASLERAKGNRNIADQATHDLYLESLGISEEEKEGVISLASRSGLKVDPVVSYIIGATNSRTYKHLIGNLGSYPIPELRLPDARDAWFLDLGCNWGRWCVAAARKGYTVVGIDPSLGAIMAARRVAQQIRLSIKYLVGDARYLPFKGSSFDAVFSYSVLQHLSKDNVRTTLSAVYRVLKIGGTSLIQMPNYFGILNLIHQIKRGFREARDFEVRYWSLPELKNTFREQIGNTTISVDCYFGLGLQKADIDYMLFKFRLLINFSERLREMSKRYGVLRYLADSVYVKSIRTV